MQKQIVVFEIGGELFGIDMDAVHEVAKVKDVMTLSDSPDAVDGFVNLRGAMIPVIDFRKKSGYFYRGDPGGQWLIILNVNNKQAGLIVDTVVDVAQGLDDRVEPLRSLLHTCRTKFLRGFGRLRGKKLSLVAPDKIVSDIKYQDYSLAGM